MEISKYFTNKYDMKVKIIVNHNNIYCTPVFFTVFFFPRLVDYFLKDRLLTINYMTLKKKILIVACNFADWMPTAKETWYTVLHICKQALQKIFNS